MGILSFTAGLCAGFYFRTTSVGKEMSRKILTLKKLLGDKHVNECKLVLIVRDDLSMSRGKIASQCSHASVLAYKNAVISDPEIANLWEAFGQSKIVLRTTSALKLNELSNEARKSGLFVNIVKDAGRTEISPGTQTVLAIGPGPKDVVDKVTGHLKLL